MLMQYALDIAKGTVPRMLFDLLDSRSHLQQSGRLVWVFSARSQQNAEVTAGNLYLHCISFISINWIICSHTVFIPTMVLVSATIPLRWFLILINVWERSLMILWDYLMYARWADCKTEEWRHVLGFLKSSLQYMCGHQKSRIYPGTCFSRMCRKNYHWLAVISMKISLDI